jgi:8-oxo-dGTP diphosphatase
MGEKLLVQVREKECNFQQVQHILSRALARAEPFGARIVVNSDCGTFPQCSGVHLTSKALMSATERPRAALVGASCHDERELDHAERIGADYAVVGPVKATPSHPGMAPLGWPRFAELARDRPMPVFAIGGLTHADLDEARRNGAHGVALRGAAFSQ